MKKKILVVEDDNILQKAISIELESQGYEVIQAFNGQDGLNKIKAVQPNLVILDLVMPVQTGEWLLEKMVQENLLDSLPVIVLSAKSDFNKDGYNIKDYMLKSHYSLEDISAKVKEILG